MSPQEEVLFIEPNAFAHDDGEWVYIYVAQEINEPCGTCKRAWKRRERRTNKPAIGSGPMSSQAWESALRTLKAREQSS